MYHRYRGLLSAWIFICTALLYAASVAITGFAEDPPVLIITLNGTIVRTYTQSQLEALDYAIPTTRLYIPLNTPTTNWPAMSTGRIQGITFDELAPLMNDAWALTVTSPDGMRKSYDSPDLAERFATLVWVTSASTPSASTTVPHAQTTPYTVEIKGEASTSTTPLSIWLSWEGIPQLKEEIRRFAQLHGITITMTEVPKISSKLVQTQRGGGIVADVVMVQADYIFELAATGMLQSLDYLQPQMSQSSGGSSFFLFGRQWAIPFYYDSQLIFCNSALFQAAGLDPQAIRTLDDLQQAARTIRSTNTGTFAPLAWNLYSAYWLLPFQFGFGKDRLIEANGSVIVNDTASIAAVDYLMGLVDQGLVSINERDAMLANFTAGKTAMMLSSSYMIPELEKLGIAFETVAFPYNQQLQRPIVPLLDYKGLAITKRSRNPILARRLIQYLTGIGVQQRLPVAIGKLPASTQALAMETPTSANRERLKESATFGYPLTPDIGYSVYKDVLWDMLRFILTGQLSVKDGLNQAQRLISSRIKDQLAQLPAEFTMIIDQGEHNDDDEKAMANEVLGDKADGGDDVGSDPAGKPGFFNWLRNLWR
jgi:ABC-type glycerol-3-phosphate transport system substrate-binding protein